jgi:hypothetical protein
MPPHDARRLDRHIDFLGILHLLWAAFNGLVGLAMACFATAAAILASDAASSRPGTEIAAGVTAGGFTIVAATALIWAIVHGWCGAALRRHESWARVIALALALFNLLLFPFGTLLAGYTVWVLLQEDARVRFDHPGEP